MPLVCKRFAALCSSPELLQTITVQLTEPALLPKLRSLCRWLVRRAAGHADVLEIALERTDRSQGPSLVGEDGAEAVAALAAAVAACDAAEPLLRLDLELDALGVPLRLSAWAAALGKYLYHLRVATSGALDVVCSLTGLQLEVLVRQGAAARQQGGLCKCPACTLQALASHPASPACCRSCAAIASPSSRAWRCPPPSHALCLASMVTHPTGCPPRHVTGTAAPALQQLI